MKTDRDELAEVDLAPCPFCGGEAVLTFHEPHVHTIAPFMPDYGGGWEVGCPAHAGMMFDDREEAVAAWNSRPQLQAAEERIAQLEAGLRDIEEANDGLCAVRTQATYLTMIDAGNEPQLEALDGARRRARALLTPGADNGH